MELKLIISGAPKGDSYWGTKEDALYIGNYYASCNESHKYEIRLRKSGSANYAFYHYLIYNNIKDYDGRDGSYICLTLRMSQYCYDFRSIYYILDMLYRKYFVGNILKEVNGGKLQYTILTFDKLNEHFAGMEETAKLLLSKVLTNADISAIPSIPTGKNLVCLNLHEASLLEVKNCIGQNGSCSMSPEYISRDEQKKMEIQYTRGLNDRKAELESMEKELIGSQNKNKDLQARLQQLENSMSSSKAAHMQVMHHGIHHSGNNHHEKTSGFEFSKFLQLVISFISLLIIAYLAFVAMPGVSDKISLLQSEAEIEEIAEEITVDELQSMNITLNDAFVDIEGLENGDEVYTGKNYKLTLIKAEDENNVYLQCIGADIINGENTGPYEIKVLDGADVVFVYFVDSENLNSKTKVLQKRVLKVVN